MNRAAALSLATIAGAVLLAAPATGQGGKDEVGADWPPETSVTFDDEADSGRGPFPWPDFADVQPLPGEYRSTVELLSFEMPGLAELGMGNMRDALADQMAEDHRYCITGDEPPEDWMARAGEDCRTLEQSSVGGQVTLRAICSGADGMAMQLSLAGELRETGSDLTLNMRMTTPEAGKITFRIRQRTERIGDCP